MVGMGFGRVATSSGPVEKKVKAGANGGRFAEDQEAEGAFVFSEKFSVPCCSRGADLKRVAEVWI